MAQVRFGPFRLDRAEHRLHRGATVIPLRPKTFAVLDHLVARAGRLVTKEQLLAAVWPGTAVTDVVLKVCVREIREALGDDPEDARYVETAHRLGYRFIGQVSVTNLPAPVSSLVGRGSEIEAISGALAGSRLLTLVGAGGSGKSRLALEVAASLRDTFEDGVWWVDLASIVDEAFVPHATAVALGVRDQPGEQPTTVLARYVSTRETLLVVDNCEHLLAATAALLQELLRAGPRLRVLATSREPLQTDGERVYRVPPLSIPESAGSVTAAQALEYEAVRLVRRTGPRRPAVVRARRGELSEPSSRSAVTSTDCRSPSSSPPRACRRFRSRRSGRGSMIRCACSLRAGGPGRPVIKRCARPSTGATTCSRTANGGCWTRLSVFAGSFTLEAAEHVGAHGDAADAESFDALSRLIDKSLVFVADRSESGGWRYRLLETVRQYADEKFRSRDHAPDVRARYIRYYRELAEKTEAGLNTAERPGRLAVLDREHSNLRGAIEQSFQTGSHREAARLAGALFWFWFHGGHWREGRTFLGAAIDRETAPSEVRARALLGDGVLAWAEGAYAAAATRLEECVTIGRTFPDAGTTAHALHFLAMVRLAEANAFAGRPLAEEAVRIGAKRAGPVLPHDRPRESWRRAHGPGSLRRGVPGAAGERRPRPRGRRRMGDGSSTPEPRHHRGPARPVRCRPPPARREPSRTAGPAREVVPVAQHRDPRRGPGRCGRARAVGAALWRRREPSGSRRRVGSGVLQGRLRSSGGGASGASSEIDRSSVAGAPAAA